MKHIKDLNKNPIMNQNQIFVVLYSMWELLMFIMVHEIPTAESIKIISVSIRTALE